MKVRQSTRKTKKWMVTLPDGLTIHYGDVRYSDFTQHRDPERLKRYLLRHRNDHIHDPHYPGFWARWHLWNPCDNPIGDAIARARRALRTETFGEAFIKS